MSKEQKQNPIERPPVVAIMGHVDHGKSSLLDYIRKSNIVAGEAGGITQHIAAYEIVNTDTSGVAKKITFIDTPGHAAFSAMRNRGARVADIAILIVSAEEGVKPQTTEAVKTILANNVPYIVAITKIDKTNANVEKVKSELLETGVYVEGYGGDIPCVPISSKSGAGIDTLIETILLLAEFEQFTGNPDASAGGFVVEAHLDEKRGISATLIVKNGTLHQGEFIVVDDSMASTRLIEDPNGKNIESATFSSPITITGFSILPQIGSEFQAVTTKREAEDLTREAHIAMQNAPQTVMTGATEETKIIPIILKADVFGSAEAIDQEINKLSTDDVFFKIIKKGVGIINESDFQLAISDKNTIIIGFNVDVDKKINDMNEADQITIKTFNIIYKLTEWLAEERENRRIKKQVDTAIGRAKILKVFSSQKHNHVAGGRMDMGTLTENAQFKLIRHDIEIARGSIEGLQIGKAPTKSVDIGNEFGMMLDCREAPLPGDIIETFKVETK